MTRTRSITLVLALALGACSSSPSHPDASTTHVDMGFTPLTDTGTSTLPDMGTPDDAWMATGSDAGCATPSTLHPPMAGSSATILCPFGVPVTGTRLYCTARTQHCCEPTTGAGTCDPTATPCPTGNVDWQCQDPVADCATGMHCCGTGTLVPGGSFGGMACANFASHFTGTHCAASCTAGTEITMCTSNGECPTGQTCMPFKTHGASVGGCM